MLFLSECLVMDFIIDLNVPCGATSPRGILQYTVLSVAVATR